MRHVAVLDVGKTNAKAVLVDLESMAETCVKKTSSPVSDCPPFPHFDTERLWRFMLSSLEEFGKHAKVDAVCATTHGAAAALVDEQGELVLPVLDYLHDGPDEFADEYNSRRPEFALTGTPRLSCGLNLGAQLFWLQKKFPREFARVRWILPYPHYWTMRLCGVCAADPTMLGAHTDLWVLGSNQLSDLAQSEGWSRLIPDVRMPGDRLGCVLPSVADAARMDRSAQVVCGIHDSNASLVKHIANRAEPFTVLSTGTWVITMSVGGRDVQLDERRDTLVNVSYRGDPVPSARFMGGREFELLVDDPNLKVGNEAAFEVMRQRIALLPSVTEGCGPFPGSEGGWVGGEPGNPELRLIAVSYYLAMMTAACVEITGGDGPVIVEGPMAGNCHYLDLLSVAVPRPVIKSSGGTGTSIGVAILAAPEHAHVAAGKDEVHRPPKELKDALLEYTTFWSDAVNARGCQSKHIDGASP